MAEGNGLLNRRAGFTGTGGSNPPLSAIYLPSPALTTARDFFWLFDKFGGRLPGGATSKYHYYLDFNEL